MKKYFHNELAEKGLYGREGYGSEIYTFSGMRKAYGKNVEDWPDKVPMKRNIWKDPGYYRGGPLKKYLLKHLNRPWNEVWSEICAVNDERSMGGWHFRMRVLRLVDTTGRWQSGSWGNRNPTPSGFTVMNGILRHYDYVPPWRRNTSKPNPDPDKVKIDGIWYWRENGIWFSNDLSKPVESWVWEGLWQMNTETSRFGYVQRRVKKLTYRKYQLNKKDKKRLGLS